MSAAIRSFDLQDPTARCAQVKVNFSWPAVEYTWSRFAVHGSQACLDSRHGVRVDRYLEFDYRDVEFDTPSRGSQETDQLFFQQMSA